MNSTLSAASAGRVDLRVHNSATNWHVALHEVGGTSADSQVRHLDGQLSLDGLDTAQADRLTAAARSLMRTAHDPDRQPNLAAADRDGLRAMLDATAGLLTRIDASQTLDGMTFDLGGGNAGTLERLRLQMNGGAENQVLNAWIDLSMDELAVTSLAGDSASLA